MSPVVKDDNPVPPFVEATGVERSRVTLPFVPPPESPVPAVTPEISPATFVALSLDLVKIFLLKLS
jgi:hypothetical protein